MSDTDEYDVYYGDFETVIPIRKGGYEQFLGGLIVESDDEDDSLMHKRDKNKHAKEDSKEKNNEFTINPSVLRDTDLDAENADDDATEDATEDAEDSVSDDEDDETSDSDHSDDDSSSESSSDSSSEAALDKKEEKEEKVEEKAEAEELEELDDNDEPVADKDLQNDISESSPYVDQGANLETEQEEEAVEAVEDQKEEDVDQEEEDPNKDRKDKHHIKKGSGKKKQSKPSKQSKTPRSPKSHKQSKSPKSPKQSKLPKSPKAATDLEIVDTAVKLASDMPHVPVTDEKISEGVIEKILTEPSDVSEEEPIIDNVPPFPTETYTPIEVDNSLIDDRMNDTSGGDEMEDVYGKPPGDSPFTKDDEQPVTEEPQAAAYSSSLDDFGDSPFMKDDIEEPTTPKSETTQEPVRADNLYVSQSDVHLDMQPNIQSKDDEADDEGVTGGFAAALSNYMTNVI